MAKDKWYFCLTEGGFIAKKENKLHLFYSIYLFYYLCYFDVYFIFSFVFALLSINFLCCCFSTFKISCMLLMILYYTGDLALHYRVFYLVDMVFWKLKNQINIIQKKK